MQSVPDATIRPLHAKRIVQLVTVIILNLVCGVCFLLIGIINFADGLNAFAALMLFLSALYFIPITIIKKKCLRVLIVIAKVLFGLLLVSCITFIRNYRYCYFATEVDTAIMTELELTTSAGYLYHDSDSKVVEREFYRSGPTCYDGPTIRKKIIPNLLILFRHDGKRELGRILEINKDTYLVESAKGQHTITIKEIIAVD